MSDVRPAGRGADSERIGLEYQPALDGVRALAVAAVLAFHGEVAGFGGGYLGVSAFFTLSGFLITSLLYAETQADGSVSLGSFYARRARRLLPAGVLLVVLVIVASRVTGWFDGVADLRAHAAGSLLQVANWVFLAGDGSYQELLAESAGAASPLEHYWSLAIEEQFYWLWPVAFVGIWKLGRNATGRLVVLGALTAAFAVVAPVVAAVWGGDAAYWASPARAAEILLGTFLAVAIAGRTVPSFVRWFAPAALGILAVCVVTFPTVGGPAYSGWLPAVGVVSTLLLLGLQVDSPTRRLLSLAPLVRLGRISYGVYLYHWPIFVVVNEERVDVSGPVLFALRILLTLGLAQVSYSFFEQPIRRASGLGVRPTFGAALGATAAAVLAAVVVVPGVDSDYWAASDEVADAAALTEFDAAAPLVADETQDAPSEAVGSGAPVTADPTPPAPTDTPTTEPLPELSRPVRVVVAGDSTAEAFGTGIVRWAAENDDLAEAELFHSRGCGFVRGGEQRLDVDWEPVADSCERWLTDDLPARVAATRPDVVAMFTSTWDVVDRRFSDGGGFTSAGPDMRERLEADLAAVTDEMLANGAGSVLWVKGPRPQPFWVSRGTAQEQPARHRILHEVMDGIAAERPDRVRSVDLAEYFEREGLTDDRDVRPDGIHADGAAAQRIAADFLGERLVRTALAIA